MVLKMVSYKEALAAGNTYFSNAKRLERTEPEKAAMIYLKANRELVKASTLARTFDEANFAMNKAEEAKTRAKKLTKKETMHNGESNNSALEMLLEEYIPNTTFSDVAGMDDLKHTLEVSVIQPIIYRDLYPLYAKGSIDGFLLFGPPGCGKTYFAKALAGELKKQLEKNGEELHIYKISAAEILNSLVGESEKMVKKLFDEAKKHKPSLIIIDEADSLLKTRNDKTDYASRIVNQFLSCYDDVRGEEIYIILTSNFPWELDPAVVRRGRIGNHIYVSLPDKSAREKLFEHFLHELNVSKINYKQLAEISEGYTPAEIESICRAAGLYKFHKSIKSGKKEPITQKDIEREIAEKKPMSEMWFEIAEKKMPKHYNNWYNIFTGE